MGQEGGGVAVVKALFDAANGLMPPNHIIDIAETLHAFMAEAPREVAHAWVAAAALQHKPGLSQAALEAFLQEATSAECAKDARKLKRCVKAFCGGKKKKEK
jgi:hypothetical protein